MTVSSSQPGGSKPEAPRVRVNGGAREVPAQPGQSLFEALAAAEIFLPSACGGRGLCGRCRLKVTEGGGPFREAELRRLTPEEREAGLRLACQVAVEGDLSVEVPADLLPARRYRARVASISDLTHDIKQLRLELILPREIDFVPGQYIQLEVPASAKNPAPVYRSYSLASDPQDRTGVELLIRRVPDGICTTWVFTELREGAVVCFNGPHGDFRLHESGRGLIFIAGGSGMAPFLSLLCQVERAGLSRPIRFYFGARSARDLFLLERMARYERVLADFRFVPALSDPLPADGWCGETGLITEVVARHHPDCRDWDAYLCGSPGMLDACVRVLTARGLPEEHIYFDKFA